MGEPGTETRSNDANSVFFFLSGVCLPFMNQVQEVRMEQKRKGKGKRKCDSLVYTALHILL